MTQLLISVKNVDEALLALQAGADVIDLKDPSNGALGPLDLVLTEKIMRKIDRRALVSATAGEGHASINELVRDIKARAELGVDIMKIAVDPLFSDEGFFDEMLKLTFAGINIVAVFFADDKVDLNLLPKLRQAGFYGAMLDTQKKEYSLPEIYSNESLNEFVDLCVNNQLISGLAGSLKPQYVEFLQVLKPTFIGFRGGVCESHVRQSRLSLDMIVDIKNMLHKHNKLHAKAQSSLTLSLHS